MVQEKLEKRLDISILVGFVDGWNFFFFDLLIWLVVDAGMGMLLWRKILKGGGVIIFSKGYVLFLVLEFKIIYVVFHSNCFLRCRICGFWYWYGKINGLTLDIDNLDAYCYIFFSTLGIFVCALCKFLTPCLVWTWFVFGVVTSSCFCTTN